MVEHQWFSGIQSGNLFHFLRIQRKVEKMNVLYHMRFLPCLGNGDDTTL